MINDSTIYDIYDGSTTFKPLPRILQLVIRGVKKLRNIKDYINVLTKRSNVFSCTGCTGVVPLCVEVGLLFLYE